MAYSVPRYIAQARVDVPLLRFKWDDWRVDDDFEYDSSHIVKKLSGVSLRARIAAGIGIYEWIIWRFRSVSEDPAPYQIAEAAWCGNVHRQYMKYDELDREEWVGPIRGPLWCAVTWLIPMVLSGDNDPEECESGLAFLPTLAVHVLPKPEAFEGWLDKRIERLVKFYSVAPEDPFEDLFSEQEEERRGPLAAPEVLDPAFDYKPEMVKALLAKYLQGVDYRGNPFLHSPEEMIREGFQGTPYVL
jgi:hypothetical protein